MEDNLTNQQVARELLLSEGAEVTVADSGLDALRLLEAGQDYDVVLMDIQMPGMDGYTATRQIRGRLGLRDLPIIAMTANAMPADRAAALDAGMDDHVAKPFDIRDLVRVILSHLAPASPPATDTPATRRHAVQEGDRVRDGEGAPDGDGGGADVLDMPQAMARLQGDGALYDRALSGFLAEAPEMVSTLHTELAAGREEEVRRTLHTLKGLAGMVGANSLAALAAAAERALLADLSPLLPPLRAACDNAMRAARDLLRDPPAPTPAVGGGVTSLKEDVQTLADLLRDSNMAALPLFEKLSPRCAHAAPEKASMLEEAIRHLDFRLAHDICIDMLPSV